MLFFSRCVRLALGLVASVSIVVGAARAVPAATVNYQVVAVGNPGNAADTNPAAGRNGFGTVSTSYYIGKYEVTIGQYVDFLNAVAKTDPNGLYNAGMNSDRNIRGITQSGTSGTFVYAAAGPDGVNTTPGVSAVQSAANRPITFVSWFNAARFANWMSNGQPTGPQGPTTTEDGAYDLTSSPTTTVAVRGTNPLTGAPPLYTLPTQDQWYKAAYYDPTLGGTGGYYAYATQSNTQPGNQVGSVANNANHYDNSTYSLTQSGTLVTIQNYLTDVGSYTGSASYYGTFDQSGNTAEWTDPGAGNANAGLRGGAWNLIASGGGFNVSTPVGTANYDTGFRLVSAVPEPGTIGILASGLGFGLWQLLRRRRCL